MKGIDLKNFLSSRGWNVSKVAELLGESRQNMSAALLKDDIKTGLVERIASVTGIGLLEFYGKDGSDGSVVAGDGSVVNNGHDQVTADPGLVSVIQEQQAQMARLISVIENLTKK